MFQTIFKSIYIKYIALLLVILLAAFFRFYDFPNRISMGYDSARDAFVAFEGARQLQFPITGPFISIAPVTTGPWYWNHLIIGKLIIGSNYAPWLIMGMYSMATIIVMFIIGYLLSGYLLGIILAIITALSPNQIDNATKLSNPSVIGFYAAANVLLLLYLLKRGANYWVAVAWGFLTGEMFTIHYQSFGMLTIPLLLVILYPSYKKIILPFLTGFIVPWIPLLFFELNNHWFNTRHLWQYLIYDQYKIFVPMRWITYISDFWPSFLSFVLGGDKVFGILVMSLIIILFIYLLWIRKIDKRFLILVISFLIQIVIIRYWRGERFFGYLQFFHPFIFIFTGLIFYTVLRLKFGKMLVTLLIILYLSAVVPTSFSRIESEKLTLETNALFNEVINKFGNNNFKVYKCHKSFRDEMYAFVLKLIIENKYSTRGIPLFYKWGCALEEEYPNVELLFDISKNSELAIAKNGLTEASPASVYASSARWWFGEQP